MPTYEYICHNETCQHEFEVFQSMKDDSLVECPHCNQPTLKRKIGLGAGIIFKGSGFYETDYKKKSEDKHSKASSAPSAEPNKKPEKKTPNVEKSAKS